MSLKKGILAEKWACDYLMSQGLHWVSSNYRCRMGEIDLIMRDGLCLVFVEVRARISTAFGGGLASVTHAKRQKLLKTALMYVMVHQMQDKQACRFDVLSLDGTPPQVTWIKNAFGSDF